MSARWLALALFVASCTTENPNYLGDTDAGGLPSMSEDLSGDVVTLLDLAVVPGNPADLSQPKPADMAVGNVKCKNVCDCPAGLVCGFNGQCQKSSFGNVYCCGSSTCPQGQTCQDTSGRFGQCGGSGGGRPDLSMGNGGVWGVNDLGMGPFWCHFIPCTDDNGCKTSGCGYCDKAQKVCM